jgi:NAD(P)-dependent dehydrogenase (short-subunit alcohol dehydrogenase family)
VPIVLDAGNDASVSRLCAAAQDVTVLITTTTTPSWPPVSIGAGDTATLAEHFAVTVLGTVRVASAFAPILAARGEGVLACVESVQAWVNLTGAYAVAQSALWSAVNSLRTELRGSGVHVLAAVGGLVEADHPSTVVAAELIMQGIRTRKNELLIDDYTAQVRARLSGPIEGIYPELE